MLELIFFSHSPLAFNHDNMQLNNTTVNRIITKNCFLLKKPKRFYTSLIYKKDNIFLIFTGVCSDVKFPGI